VVRFQLVIDCADPDRLARFWAAALHYELEPAPQGFDSWDDYYRDLGIGEEDLDISVGGDRSVPIETRRARVDAGVQRLVGLGATMTRALAEPGLDHYGVAMTDPEGNEFDIN
jgi:hypothetical protein